MESYKVVRPEHLNHFGYLFGGFLLKWVDEIAWIAASRDHPGCSFVTVTMDRVEFRRGVRQGAVLRFDASESQERLGEPPAPPAAAAPSGLAPKQVADMLHAVMAADRTVYAKKVINRLVKEHKVIKASEYYEDEKALPF